MGGANLSRLLKSVYSVVMALVFLPLSHRQGGWISEPWGMQRGLADPHRSLPLSRASLQAKLPRVSANSVALLLRPDVSTYSGGPRLPHALCLQEDSSSGFLGSQTLLGSDAHGMETHTAGWWVHGALQGVHDTSHHPALSKHSSSASP